MDVEDIKALVIRLCDLASFKNDEADARIDLLQAQLDKAREVLETERRAYHRLLAENDALRHAYWIVEGGYGV